MLQKLETVLEDSKNYRIEECVIDSLMRIEDDNYDRCGSNHVGGCYYCVHDFPGEQILSDVRVCNHLMGEDLSEVM